MIRSSRQEDFLLLRKKYPLFIFEKQEYSLTGRGLDITFTFNLAGQYEFHPSLFIPRKSCFLPDEKVNHSLDAIVFNLGLIELISYWKAACPPIVIVKPFGMTPEQIAWWKKLYFHGLGEFFYLNSIPVTSDNFMHLEVASDTLPDTGKIVLEHGVIVPVGGGKDSAVTLELLGKRMDCVPLIINPRGASLETIYTGGYEKDQLIEIRRTIDPELLRLNDLGFLNGHTPFSAMLAFVTVLSAILTGRRHIALSNESSANEPTIEGTMVNHQYSKSLRFESDFRQYVAGWISNKINYFSFLRPLNELQIAALFAWMPAYHPVFRSCNAGSKTDIWCGSCAKCLFTYCILGPFLSQDKLVNIFGKNLLEDVTLKPILGQLTGLGDEKPFDCVGTIEEVNLAMCEIIRKQKGNDLPVLLQWYKDSALFAQYSGIDFKEGINRYEKQHFLLSEFSVILEEGMRRI